MVDHDDQPAIRAARAAADVLVSLGQLKMAEDVRHLCRSNAGMRGTLAALHRDNMQLRKELAVIRGQQGEIGSG